MFSKKKKNSVCDKAKKAYLQTLQVCVYLRAVEKDRVICRHGKLDVSQLFDWKDLVPSGSMCTSGWISVSKGFYLLFRNACVY